MKHTRLAILMASTLVLTSTAWAKFCSECGKPLPSDTAKFCSECGASVNGNNAKDNSVKTDTRDELLRVKDKLDCMEEFCIYLESSNRKTCMEKFPDCKFRFNKGLEELSREQLSDNQKALVELYKFKWDLVEICYKDIVNNTIPMSTIYVVKKVNDGIQKCMNGATLGWTNKFIGFCKACIIMKSKEFKVESDYMVISNAVAQNKLSNRMKAGYRLKAVDINGERICLMGRTCASPEFDFYWVDRDEVFKRTNIEERIGDKVKAVDVAMRALEAISE